MMPTIGRIVVYRESDGELNAFGHGENGPDAQGTNGTREHPAMITRVWGDTCVNLLVFFDARGAGIRTSAHRLADMPDGVVDTSGNPGWRWPSREVAGLKSTWNSLPSAPMQSGVDVLPPASSVTKEEMSARIASIDYVRFGATVTLCSVTLDNGYSVRGESACVDPAKYDREIGERLAFADAYRKLWPLFGFLLAERHYLNNKAA